MEWIASSFFVRGKRSPALDYNAGGVACSVVSVSDVRRDALRSELTADTHDMHAGMKTQENLDAIDLDCRPTICSILQRGSFRARARKDRNKRLQRLQVVLPCADAARRRFTDQLCSLHGTSKIRRSGP